MKNASILAAFERMWQHVVSLVGSKSDIGHTHDDKYYTETEIDTKLSNKSDKDHTHTGYVPTSRTINGKALSSNITLSASDVGALPSSTTIPSIAGLATETYVDNVASTKVDKVSGKGLSTNDYTTTEKNKLSGIAAGAEVNQNAFSNVVVGSTTIAADSETDSLTIAAGTGISVAGDATNDKVTITNSGVRSIATGSSNGTISVNTNGSSADVAVKGLGSAAYTASTAYDAAGTAQTKADAALASAKSYADGIKNDLLNGAGTAYDTLKELGDLIDINVDAIDALETVAASKANASDLTSHTGNKSNPHGVTLAQLGVTATAAELNIMDGVTATAAEINKLDGVTATTAELNYVDGVTSNIQTQLNAKQATVTGAATTITGSNLTASRALVSDSSGKVAVSAVTSTELGYLDGVTSAIQTQLDGKSDSGHDHNYAGSSSAGGAATSANKVNSSLTVKLNGGSTEGTNMFTFNGSAAKSVNITASAIGAADSSHSHDDKYYTESEIDTKISTLNTNISAKAAASDLTSHTGNKNNPHGVTAAQISAVPTSRTVNGKALSSNITLSASDVSARPSTWTPTASDVGAVPTSRTVNGKALSANISLVASDVGAAPSSHNHDDKYYTESEIDSRFGAGNVLATAVVS